MYKVLFIILCATCIYGTIYDFETLSNKLINTSPKLKQYEVDVIIAKENINIANAEYYPNLKIAVNSEYSKKFEGLFVPSYVGEDSITQSSGRYFSSSLYLSYELFNFGATKYSTEVAKQNLSSASAAKCIKEKESVLSLLDAYSKLRTGNYQLKGYGRIQELYQELYSLTKRLYESGRLAKTNSMEYAKELADVLTLISNTKEERAGHISQIMYLSGVEITAEDTILPLEKTTFSYEDVPFEKSNTAKQLRAVIAQKQAKVNLQKTAYLPVISFYGKYDMYGSSDNSYNAAFDNLERNGYRIGISFSWSLFDGFRNEAEVSIKKMELMQSRFAYEDTKRAYEQEQFMTQSQIASEHDRLESIGQSSNFSLELVQAESLLYEAGELDKITLLNNQINQLKIDIVQNEALERLNMNIKKREIMNEKESRCVAH
ncbi:MAG: TolC family protein [Campylobacteraceae bacterium]|jgi:outer membrane protein TolC|nr:TolC family protein [Campylobacteraceae bacterium]